jgi:hypothetical protein
VATVIRKRDLGWLPTVVVLAVVLIAGSRLIYLSVQHHAAAAKVTAASVAAGHVRKIDPELQKLGDLATRQAALGAKTLANTESFTSLDSVRLAPNTLWMTTEDKVLASRSTDAANASGIASEWESAESSRPVPGASVLGPMRLGSEWLLAVRVPVVPATLGTQPESRGWAVAYADLDDLIATSHLPRLVDSGYDFELSQVDPRSARSRIFVSSSTEPMTDAVVTRIQLPNGFTPATPGSYLQVALPPTSDCWRSWLGCWLSERTI